jgi:NAD(P)-dependent dehydrogenase (short-subunit alcohol dehydrogenase family)
LFDLGKHPFEKHKVGSNPPFYLCRVLIISIMDISQTWFITGASQGLGLALTRQLLAAGHRVAATSRRLDSLTQAVSAPGAAFLPLQADLVDEASVAQAVQATLTTFGRLDVVVNNAGYGLGGSVEELTDTEAREAFEVNVFGALNVVRQALPHLRRQGTGHIINISSIAGLAPLPGWGIYSATKFALEGVSESLAQEVAAFGLKVTLVEPGGLRTNFLTATSLTMARQPLPAYEAVRTAHAELLTKNGRQIGDPDKAALAIMRVTQEAQPPLRLLLGTDAYERAQQHLQTQQQEFTAWQQVSTAIGFEA